MERSAIDMSGCLGTLYDLSRDCLTGTLRVLGEVQSCSPEDPVQCEIISGGTDKSCNVLQIIGVQDDLRLSIVLNLAPRTGLASIIDYPQALNDDTRIIYYCYTNQEQRLTVEMTSPDQLFDFSVLKTTSTHIVTAVSWGIIVVIVVQSPVAGDLKRKIDDILENVRNILIGNHNSNSFTKEDEDIFRQHTGISVYSNISFLKGMTSVRDICKRINRRDSDSRHYLPLKYTLTSIKSFDRPTIESRYSWTQLEPTDINSIERYLLKTSDTLKNLKYIFDQNITALVEVHLKEKVHEAQQLRINLNRIYESEIKRLANLIPDIRRGKVKISDISSILNSTEAALLADGITQLTNKLYSLKEKFSLINGLKEQQIEYCNVVKYNFNHADIEATLEQKLVRDRQHDRVLCSNDFLNDSKLALLDKLRAELMKERKSNSSLHLIYADFSDCLFKLQDIMILPSKINNKDNHATQQKEAASLISTEETINILLLGETGVGKSTFINAFANYLRFNTLDQARSDQPIVLIPVSFLITTGHNFVERNITFGDADQSNNEDFDQPGHSVTQHCRSYLFQHLDHTHIRLIDTPGFGDTRGVDQDDHNMQHIIEYVKSLSHINAVCFLLKPNESRLNIFFRSCLTQLFSLLGSEIGDNVVFCFTNCRSTFYTPGNTAPLLKKMLTSLSMDRVTLRKENTFCFDSESFRYLVASQHKIEFDDDEKKEYGRSWTTSVTEANRLIYYISKQVGIYSLKKECQSIEDAKLEIILMIRPILETVRNTFRNIILCRMSACKTIVLQPTALHRPATICLSCDVSPHLVGGFWIVRDLPHEIYEKCVTCSCALKQHIPMTYKLAHKVNDGMDSQHENDMFNEISLLLNVCVDFACFLTHVTHLLRDDSFESALKRMIDEESNICRNQRPNQTNSELIKELKKFQSRYEQRMKEMKSKEEHHELSVIYGCIKTMHKYPVVREQMASIKEQRNIIKKHNESEVQENGSGARL